MQETLSRSTQATHIVVIVHGNRTFSGWQETLESLIHEQLPRAKVHKHNYGFSSIPFLRWIATNRFRQDLMDIAAQYPNAQVDIVAYGFGTYLVGRVLMRCAKARCLRIHTIILASSVLKTSFPWSRLMNEGMVQRVVNECAAKDLALVFKILIPFRGGAGFLGASGILDDDKFRNNWYSFGQSGFFKYAGLASDGFMRTRWLPALMAKPLPRPIDERDQTWHLGFLRLFLENDPIKLLIWALPVFLSTIALLRLSAEGQATRQVVLARQLAIQAERLISDQGSFPQLSALLSIESLQRSRTLGSDHTLRRALPFLNSPFPVASSPEKVLVAKATPGPNSMIGVSAVTLFDPVIRQQFLALNQQSDNLDHEKFFKTATKFDTRGAHLVSISPDGLYLATGNADGMARVFDVQNGKAVSEIPSQVALTGVAISPDGRYVATGYLDGMMRISELRGGSTTAEFKFNSAVTRAEFSGDGQYLMTVTQDKMVRLFSMTNRRAVAEHRFDNHKHEVQGLALSFDGQYFAIDFGPLIQTFNTATWDQFQNFISTTKARLRLTFSPSGRYLAVVDPSDLVQILDLGPGRVVRELRHASVDHGEPLDWLPASFSPDERYLAVVNRNNSISLFDLSTGTEVSNIIDEDIYCIQFGVDEPRKSAVALDQTTTRRHGLGTVRALAFSSNGRDLIVAYRLSIEGNRSGQRRFLTDQETIVSRYLVRPDDLIAEACSRLKQNLTPQQWKQYLGDTPYQKTCPSLQ